MDFGRQNKKQTIMGVVLTTVLVATAATAYFGYFREPSVETSLEMPTMSATGEIRQPSEIIKKIDFDEEFLKEARFQALKIYGQWPIKLGDGGRGRLNPFLSLEKSTEEEIKKKIEEEIEEEIMEEEIMETEIEEIEEEIMEGAGITTTTTTATTTEEIEQE